MNQATGNDSAGVLAPAPVFFGTSIVAGVLLERLFPTFVLSFPYATAVGALLIVVSVALVLSAVVSLAHAHTAFDARKPTTSIVTTGAFRFSRNPTSLSLALLLSAVIVPSLSTTRDRAKAFTGTVELGRGWWVVGKTRSRGQRGDGGAVGVDAPLRLDTRTPGRSPAG